MKRIIVLLLCLGIIVFSIQAQQITKFGVVDTSLVYTNYFRDSVGVRNYEKKKTEFQDEINKYTEELKALQSKKLEYEKNDDDTNAQKIQTQITKKTQFLQEYTTAKNTELNTMKKKLESSDEFYNQLYDIIARIAERDGYSMILSLQQSSSILWYSSAVDITDKVIAEISKL